jgi:hypothetical protein
MTALEDEVRRLLAAIRAEREQYGLCRPQACTTFGQRLDALREQAKGRQHDGACNRS